MAMFVKPPKTQRIECIFFPAKTEKDTDLKTEQVPSRQHGAKLCLLSKTRNKRKRLRDLKKNKIKLSPAKLLKPPKL